MTRITDIWCKSPILLKNFCFTCTPVCAQVHSVICNVITCVDLHTYHRSQDTEELFQIKEFFIFTLSKVHSPLSNPTSTSKKPWISYFYFQNYILFIIRTTNFNTIADAVSF